MDKIAIISDIHGNLEALKTVLNDINDRGIKIVYCLGDIIAKGVNSSECIKLIKDNCQIVLRGNCDEFFTKSLNLDEFNDIQKKRIIWNKSMLSDDDFMYLQNLPFCYEFYMSGSLVRLFHSTPTNIEQFIGNLDSLDKKRSLFYPSSNTISQEFADVIIYGHIHYQYLDRYYNRTIVNAGSVGNPIEIVRNDDIDANVSETIRANYLIIEGNLGSKKYDDSLSFQFVRIPYNIKKELDTDKFNIEKEEYERELLYGNYRDMEKIKKSFQERNIDMDKF